MKNEDKPKAIADFKIFFGEADVDKDNLLNEDEYVVFRNKIEEWAKDKFKV